MEPCKVAGSVPITGTRIIQHHKCLGGTRKLSNSSLVHTWSVSPAAMAGVTDFHFFRDPFWVLSQVFIWDAFGVCSLSGMTEDEERENDDGGQLQGSPFPPGY